MVSSLRRTAVILSLISTLMMAGGANAGDAQPKGDAIGPELGRKAAALLAAVEFTVRDGFADLAVKKDGRTIPIADFNLIETATKVRQAPVTILLLAAMVLWAITPLTKRLLRRRAKSPRRPGRPAVLQLPPLLIKPSAALSKIRPRQAAKKRPAVLLKNLRAGAAVDFRVKRYQARHAAGGRWF